MAETRRGPALANRPTPKVTTTTSCHPTQAADIAREYERGFLAGWLDRAEYARRTKLTFDDGVEWGWYLASRAMNNAIAEAVAGMDHDSVEIVRQLVRVWDRPEVAR